MCKARRVNDQMMCECGLAWDVADTEPPECPRTVVVKCDGYSTDEHRPTYRLGDRVRKTKGSQWQGVVVGTYSTSLTPEGYCVESETEHGSVQIYPATALERVK